MATAKLNQIDDKLKEIYSNQITTNSAPVVEDRSEMLLAQMNFIAMTNMQTMEIMSKRKDEQAKVQPKKPAEPEVRRNMFG